MGCDGWIVLDNSECKTTFICYECNERIDPTNRHDINQHAKCSVEDGRIPVMVEISNYVIR